MSMNFYRVYIACMKKDANGSLTKDYMLAKQLYRKLEQKNIHAFLMGKSNPDDRTEALHSADVFIVAGTSAKSLMSDTVRNDYEDFIADVELSGKSRWRVFNYLSGMTANDLPAYLRAHRTYDPFNSDELINKIEKTLSGEPKKCISDADENLCEESVEDIPESLPDCAESAIEYEDDGDDGDLHAHGHVKARRVPQTPADDEDHSGEESGEQAESEPEQKPVKVRPAKINKVDFSVVAPDEVKPGKSSVIDLLMYTRSQRAVVRRTINQAKEKSSEAARTSGSVSVRQGSRVTAQLFSDDIGISDGSRTMVWNGDALDFKFRVTPPDDYSKKQIDFGCSVLFDGIEITRLYFTVPVGFKKKPAVRFTRKDCRRAFVSYSHRDRLRVAEQLLAIQEVAPKLRFWMDNRSMTAGDVWRNAIASAIRKADVFLLFWSVSAKASSEVRKEWEYALQLEQSAKRRRKNGSRFISPVPLDSPSECPPPEELGDLHFGDPSFDSDIENIEKVKVWAVKGRNIKFF